MVCSVFIHLISYLVQMLNYMLFCTFVQEINSYSWPPFMSFFSIASPSKVHWKVYFRVLESEPFVENKISIFQVEKSSNVLSCLVHEIKVTAWATFLNELLRFLIVTGWPAMNKAGAVALFSIVVLLIPPSNCFFSNSLSAVAGCCSGFAKQCGRCTCSFQASYWTVRATGCKADPIRDQTAVTWCPAAEQGNVRKKEKSSGEEISINITAIPQQ